MLVLIDADRHVYELDGLVRLPSVTHIISAVAGNHYPPGPYRERGKQVHDLCGKYDLGWEIDDIGAGLQGYFDAYRRVHEAFKLNYSLIEKPLYDRELLVAGTVDRAGAINDTIMVADIKTGQPRPETALQLAAYARMVSLEHFADCPHNLIRRFEFDLHEDGTYKAHEFKDPLDFEGWEGMVKYHRWKTNKQL